jgi:hypothetical protein
MRHFPPTRPLPRIAAGAFFVLLLAVRGNPPAWWQEGDIPVIDPTAGSNNQGPANIGQAKWMAMRALETLTTLDSALAAGIRDKLTLPQPKPSAPEQFDPAILDFTIPPTLPAGWQDRQRAPLLIGQLKAIAAPFYDRLHAAVPDWLDHESADSATQGQLQLNGTRDPNDPAHFYPWSADPGDDHNHAPATIGQLKAVFSLRFETIDADRDGLSDLWEMRCFSNLDQTGIGDPDHDSLTNLQEQVMGSNPTAVGIDADTDGLPDDWELANAGTCAVYPPLLNATLYRSQSTETPAFLSNDTAAPVNYTIALSDNMRPGYSFLDSVTGDVPFVWEEIRWTGTRLAAISNADDLSQAVVISGFTFPFRGSDFSQVYVSSNGLLTFGESCTAYNNTTLPSASPMPALIAALWDDLDTSTTGDIYYMEKSDRLIVQYQDVGKYGDTGTYTFQVVLFANGLIQLRYHTLNGSTTSCTVGIQDASRILALQMVCNAAYLTDQMAIEIRHESAFFSAAPLTGTLAAHSVAMITGVFQSLMLPPATYDATLSIAHDGGGYTPPPINARLRVLDHPTTVALVKPLADGTMLQWNALELLATAEDADRLERVEFHDGTLLLGSSSGPYFSYHIWEPAPGLHSFVARAFDVFGTATDSAPVMFTILMDTDQDGMPDDWESAHALNPNDPADATQDPDHDDYTNHEEYQNSTNPHVVEDTDGDGMPDGWEIHHGLHPALDDRHLDLDGDTLTNLQEYQLGTDPNDPDSDADALPDAWEVMYYLNPNSAAGEDGNAGDPDADGVTNFVEWQYGSNPRNPDTDGDGTNDGDEINQGSNPNDAADKGVPPPADEMESVMFRVGDPSGSRSETWNMRITGLGPQDHRTISVASPSYGEMGQLSLQLRRNNRYEVTLEHLRTEPWQLELYETPDFDWEAQIDGLPTTQVLPNATTQTTANTCFVLKNHWLVDNKDGLLGVVNQSFHATNFTPGKKALLQPISIAVDANRDGMIDEADWGKVTKQNPWRFWNNDDHDIGDTGGSDIPHETQEDFCNTSITSMRDLIDYFPARLEIRNLLQILPEDQYTYWLSYDPVHFMQAPGYSGFRSPFLKVAWNPEAVAEPDGTSLNSGAWQKDLAKASILLGKNLYFVNPYASGGTETSIRIPSAMLQAAKAGNGLIWLSSGHASKTSSGPLQIIVKDSSNQVAAFCSLPLSISSVEDMLRLKYVTPGAADLTQADIPGNPPNWPDAERNGKHFVFVHGYNVNESQSKGWATEVFKRMFWSGSNARFSAFAWNGSQSQTADLPIVGHITPDYQVNLEHAFGTAKSFKQFLDRLEGEKTVAAHSMGNIVVGSAMHDWGARPANYLMVNSAAAKECYDPQEADDAVQDARMVHPAWKDYPKQVRASEWHRLIPPDAWPSSDWRGKLTWKGRLENVITNGGQTKVYNFFSSGEEVLNNPETNNPDLNSSNPFDNGKMFWVTSNKMWAMQEKRKGLGLTGMVHSSNYGGWMPNLLPFIPAIHVQFTNVWGLLHRMKTATELPALSDPKKYLPAEKTFLRALSTKPFFDDTSHVALFTPEIGNTSPGSAYAEQHSNTLIVEMIPCTTFAAGRNPLQRLEDEEESIINVDMNNIMKTDPDQWPESDANEGEQWDQEGNLRPNRPWLHSDIREKAFSHNWKVFKKFVEIGTLDQSNQ